MLLASSLRIFLLALDPEMFYPMFLVKFYSFIFYIKSIFHFKLIFVNGVKFWLIFFYFFLMEVHLILQVLKYSCILSVGLSQIKIKEKQEVLICVHSKKRGNRK